MNKFNTADRVLCIVFLLFLIILGLRIVFPHSLILDFLLFVAEAALVGGIADWFAVTALFKNRSAFRSIRQYCRGGANSLSIPASKCCRRNFCPRKNL